MTSPDYSTARSTYLKAVSTFQLADKNYERAKDLLEHKAIAERDLQQAESDRAEALADQQAAADGSTSTRHSRPRKPDEGAAEEYRTDSCRRARRRGKSLNFWWDPDQLLQAGSTQCYTISDMSTVWVLVNVYQSDLAYVHVGDNVEITTDSYPDTFHGKISYVADALDPNTRTLQARIVTQNPQYKLKKDMYVTATRPRGRVGRCTDRPRCFGFT